MNGVFAINFFVMALMLALYISESFGAIILLFFYKDGSKKVTPYVVPIWELTGTFIAFWVVTSDFAYPSILVPAAFIYAVPLLILLIAFIGRNAFIIFGEFIKKGFIDEKAMYKIFSIFECIFCLVFVIFASSVVTGGGVILSKLAFNVGKWATTPGDVLFVVGTVIFIFGLSFIFYGLEKYKLHSIVLTYIGIILAVVAFVQIHLSISTVPLSPVLAIPILIGILAPILFYIDSTRKIVENKIFFLALLVISVYPFYSLVYPKFFGGTLPVSAFLTNSPMATAYFYITLGGGILLIAMLAYMVYVANGFNKMVAEKA
ncbi:hypothetical protein [Thermoplasma volcanium GSS1]|uniref:Cytochrome d ubiquinol oxidase subunit II n=1 Tax=Thermoplasma volcanium (strain ATCC 51530 / DSM 4299 / JCM 9571 / NBRC 15438 / GSS1) TaxID=273116 RepID=Q97CM0_THEVO|nr:hypothetical protein [Thermoplasma volcanium]BAB59223.1 hypothetical protein [Thermoplasma volcanium GSS1]